MEVFIPAAILVIMYFEAPYLFRYSANIPGFPPIFRGTWNINIPQILADPANTQQQEEEKIQCLQPWPQPQPIIFVRYPKAVTSVLSRDPPSRHYRLQSMEIMYLVASVRLYVRPLTAKPFDL